MRSEIVDDLLMSVYFSLLDCSCAVPNRIYICTMLHEKFHDFEMPISCGEFQWEASDIAVDEIIDFCAVFK